MIYKSYHCCSDKAIQEILERSRRNNAKKDITGCLLYSDKLFVQYLEGNRRDLETLYAKIECDSRHSEINQISIGPLHVRIFPTWAMGAQSTQKHDFNLIHELEQKSEVESVLNGPNNFAVLHQIKKLFE